MHADWSHFDDHLKEPTIARDDESGERGCARISGLGCADTRAGERYGLVGQFLVGRLEEFPHFKGHDRTRALNVCSIFNLSR